MSCSTVGEISRFSHCVLNEFNQNKPETTNEASKQANALCRVMIVYVRRDEIATRMNNIIYSGRVSDEKQDLVSYCVALFIIVIRRHAPCDSVSPGLDSVLFRSQ
jgi:hypothetical protein